MTGLDWTSVEDVVEYPIAAAGESFYLSEGGRTLLLRGLRVTRGFVDVKKDQNASLLWIVDAKGERLRQLTEGTFRDTAPA